MIDSIEYSPCIHVTKRSWSINDTTVACSVHEAQNRLVLVLSVLLPYLPSGAQATEERRQATEQEYRASDGKGKLAMHNAVQQSEAKVS